ANLIYCSTALLTATCASQENPPSKGTDERISWQSLAPFFEPPSDFRNAFGNYRSPLHSANGTLVKSPADWARRRKEILAQWQQLMGPWPRLIDHPKLEFLAQSHRDNFTQYHVRLQIAPQQTGDGWLLVPEGKRPLPAVLVLYYEPETS